MNIRNIRNRWAWVPVLIGMGLAILGCSLFSRGLLIPSTGQKSAINGEQIYLTATSQRGDPITFTMGGGMVMRPGGMACVSCHGPDGKGGQVRMMMGSFTAPDIRYSALTSSQDTDHPAYTDETIKRAITQGLDPAGKSLDWPMPRWSMSDQDLNDLIDYLKTLK